MNADVAQCLMHVSPKNVIICLTVLGRGALVILSNWGDDIAIVPSEIVLPKYST